MALTDKLTAIANAIRAKTGGSAALTLTDMPTAISGIVTNNGLSVAAISSQYVTVDKYFVDIDFTSYTSAPFIFVDGVGGDVVYFNGSTYTFLVKWVHGEGNDHATITNHVYEVASDLWAYRNNESLLYIIT